MALTTEERARCVYFLGYPDTDTGTSAVGGYPREYELVLIVHSAMGNVNDTAIGRIRSMLQTLEGIERQMGESTERMQVQKVGDLALNQGEAGQLEQEYRRWARRLAELLGCRPNPYSSRFGDNHQKARIW